MQDLEIKIRRSIGKKKVTNAGTVLVEQLETESSEEDFELEPAQCLQTMASGDDGPPVFNTNEISDDFGQTGGARRYSFSKAWTGKERKSGGLELGKILEEMPEQRKPALINVEAITEKKELGIEIEEDDYEF